MLNTKMFALVLVAILQSAEGQLPADIWEFSATQLMDALRTGQFTSAEYTDAVIQRIISTSFLNIYINQFTVAELRLEAQRVDVLLQQGLGGKLIGVPMAIKDNINSRALPTTGGTPALVNWQPSSDAPTLTVLLQEDGIMTGKVNLHELAKGWTSENAYFGPVRNPYNTSRVAGGSSGGTGAALATRISLVGLGSDTGGSGRVPASFCGGVGFRPTWGRYSLDGVIPLQLTRDSISPMANTVEDVQLLDALLCQTQTPTRCDFSTPVPDSLVGVRIGISRKFFYEDLDPETAVVVEKSLQLLRSAGAVLVEADIPDLPRVTEFVNPMVAYDSPREIMFYLASQGADISYLDIARNAGEEVIRSSLMSYLENPVGIEEFTELYTVVQPAYRAEIEGYLDEYNLDVMAHPTTQYPAPEIGQTIGLEVGHNTEVATGAGTPAISVPGVELTETFRLPVGLEFMGRSGDDNLVLHIARLYDEIRPQIPLPPIPNDLM